MCCVQMYKTLLKIRLRLEFVYLIGYNTAAHFIYTHCVYFLLINFKTMFPRAFSIAVVLLVRVERPILVTWKISRAGTPRKLNVVLLSWRVREHLGGQKMHRLDNYKESWVMFAPPARAKRLQWNVAFMCSYTPASCITSPFQKKVYVGTLLWERKAVENPGFLKSLRSMIRLGSYML
jgi:hypothetical protein